MDRTLQQAPPLLRTCRLARWRSADPGRKTRLAGSRAEGKRQKANGRKRKREQKAKGRRQKAENVCAALLVTSDRSPSSRCCSTVCGGWSIAVTTRPALLLCRTA